MPTRRSALRTLVALTLSVMLWASAFAGIRVGICSCAHNRLGGNQLSVSAAGARDPHRLALAGRHPLGSCASWGSSSNHRGHAGQRRRQTTNVG